MTGQELSDLMADNQRLVVEGICYDCQCPVTIRAERISSTEIAVTGGALFKPPDLWQMDDPYLCKCDACYEQAPMFGRPTMVYSRVVGYMRPVSAWNGAKQSEFKLRKTFEVKPEEY